MLFTAGSLRFQQLLLLEFHFFLSDGYVFFIIGYPHARWSTIIFVLHIASISVAIAANRLVFEAWATGC